MHFPFKNLVIKTTNPLRISCDHPWCGYGYFLDLHTVTLNIFFPQVRAVKFGHVLVVDEADKAPTHVTCILKSLVESGVMVLGDGRRIVTGK